MVEACLPLFIASLSSSFSMGSRTWYDVLSAPVKTSLTREWGSSLAWVDSWYHSLTVMVLGPMPAFFRRFCVFFWLHILFIKRQVDVVSGECQSFIIKVLTGLLTTQCPPFYSANTTRCWWRHGHKAGRKRWNTKKMSKEPSTNTMFSSTVTSSSKRYWYVCLQMQTLFS